LKELALLANGKARQGKNNEKVFWLKKSKCESRYVLACARARASSRQEIHEIEKFMDIF